MNTRLASLTGLVLTLSLTACAVAPPGQGYPGGQYGGAPAGQGGAPAGQGGPPVAQVDPMSVIAPALILGGLWIAGQWLFDGHGHRTWQPAHRGYHR